MLGGIFTMSHLSNTVEVIRGMLYFVEMQCMQSSLQHSAMVDEGMGSLCCIAVGTHLVDAGVHQHCLYKKEHQMVENIK